MLFAAIGLVREESAKHAKDDRHDGLETGRLNQLDPDIGQLRGEDRAQETAKKKSQPRTVTTTGQPECQRL